MLQIANEKIREYKFYSLADTILYLIDQYVKLAKGENGVSKASIEIFNQMYTRYYGSRWGYLFVGRVSNLFFSQLKEIAKINGYSSHSELVKSIVYAFVNCKSDIAVQLLLDINKSKSNQFGIPIKKKVCSIFGKIPSDRYEIIKSMADSANIPLATLYNRCLDLILYIEYQERCIINSHIQEILKKEMCQPGVRKKHFWKDVVVGLQTTNLHRYARILCIMEKYSIRSKIDLFDRLTNILLNIKNMPLPVRQTKDQDEDENFIYEAYIKKDFVRSLYS